MTELPEGYRKEVNERGRVIYISPPPHTRITNRAMLLDYQEKGKFLDLDAEKINFVKKKPKTPENLTEPDGYTTDQDARVLHETTAVTDEALLDQTLAIPSAEIKLFKDQFLSHQLSHRLL